MRLLDRVRRPLARADALVNRIYGWEGNPLYHSGVIAAALLATVMVTGVYLLLFYRIGSPYASVARITNDILLGRWMRSFHRYASDAAVAFTLLHILRMVLQRRTWGPRALAWISGLVLLGLLFVCGWTGYVMVWDVQAEVLAREGARFFDALPLFSEPISRTFDGERALPGAFFFLNLFAHVALPVGLGVVFWVHVARVARPQLLPPRALAWSLAAAFTLASALIPVTMAPAADLSRLPGRAPYDFWYAFFLPLTRPVDRVWLVWLLGGAAVALSLVVPWLMRPRVPDRPAPSVVDQEVCTGCEQCYIDCPYEAISMVASPIGRPHLVAQVDPDLCTSCGLCAGSCAPMSVGPPGRTGRDQLARVRQWVRTHPVADQVVLIACGRGAGGVCADGAVDGAPVYEVTCAGNVHSSVVEYLVRSGAGGVLVVSCPPRDCWNREGPVWTRERLFHDREAELQPRVDKARVRLVYAGESEHGVVIEGLADFRSEVRRLTAAPAEERIDVERACDPPPPEESAVP